MDQKYKVMIFVSALALIYISVFYFVPNSLDSFSFVPGKILSEPWRLFTYPFVHVNAWHLWENVASIVLIGFLAIELKTDFYDLVVIYLSTSVLAVMPVFIISHFSAAGASAAIYAGFGIIAQDLARYKIMPAIPLTLLTLSIFAQSFMSIFECGFSLCESLIFSLRQGFAHFSGLVLGTLGYRLMNDHTLNPNSILRGVANGS